MNRIKIKEIFDFLYLQEKDLTAGQISYINSCRREFQKQKYLSEAQTKVLFEIAKYMSKKPQRMAMK